MGNVIHKNYHESVYIDNDVEIGDHTKIWHFTHILRGAVIGKNCIIGQNCFIAGTIGDNCKIQNNVSIFKGVILENDVFFGPGSMTTNVLNPRAFIEQKESFEPKMIRQGASIGACAVVLAGVEIGRYSMIGAGSIITKDVMPYSMTFGNPAKHWGWICKNGCKMNQRYLDCPVCGVTND